MIKTNEIITVKGGGTTVATPERIKNIAEIWGNNDSVKYMVVSAPGTTKERTTKLTELLQQGNVGQALGIFEDICDGLGVNMMDYVSAKIKHANDPIVLESIGEHLNAKIIANYMGATFVDSRELIHIENRIADNNKTRAQIQGLRKPSGDEKFVIPGYYGMDSRGRIELLPRGGSDLTGSLIAANTRSTLYENWTDVDGIMVADPRIVGPTKIINKISYREIRELAYGGATVFNDQAVGPVWDSSVPVVIKNYQNPDNPGTTISHEHGEEYIRGLAGKEGFYKLNINKFLVNNTTGAGALISQVLEKNDISYDMESTSVDTLTRFIQPKFMKGKEERLLNDTYEAFNIPKYSHVNRHSASVTLEKELALICLVGEDIDDDIYATSKITGALADSNIAHRIYSGSDASIIARVSNEDYRRATKVIHDRLFRKYTTGRLGLTKI